MRNIEASNIRVQDLDHCGLIAGICDEMGLVELVDKLLGTHPQEIISPGQVVKAMILNGLGFVSAPLYLFEKLSVQWHQSTMAIGRESGSSAIGARTIEPTN